MTKRKLELEKLSPRRVELAKEFLQSQKGIPSDSDIEMQGSDRK